MRHVLSVATMESTIAFAFILSCPITVLSTPPQHSNQLLDIKLAMTMKLEKIKKSTALHLDSVVYKCTLLGHRCNTLTPEVAIVRLQLPGSPAHLRSYTRQDPRTAGNLSNDGP